MAIKAALSKEEFDALEDEDLKRLYTESNGRFQLAVTAAMGLELADTAGLKSSLQKERESVKSLTASLKPYEGLDAEQARKAIDTVAELGDQASVDDKIAAGLKEKETQLQRKFEQDRDALVKKYDTDLANRDGTITTLENQLERELVTTAATTAITGAKGSTKLLLPVVRGMVKMTATEDGQRVAQVLDGAGHVRLSTKSGSTDPMSIDELVEELRQDSEFARGFDGTGASGSGASGSDRGGGSGSHRISAEDAKDPVKYRAAKDAADKAGQELQLQE